MRAALYARVSTERQKDEETVQNQLGEIKKAIITDGNSLLEGCEYIDEGWSGAIIERPSLDNLRQDALDKKFDILYVYDRGRLARKFMHQEIVIEELTNLGITFKSLHDINGDSPEERLLGGVMGIFHEYERLKISERFRIGKLNKVRSGKLLGYQAPYGYDYIPIVGHGLSKINGRFEINEEEANVVRMIFEWIAIDCISIKEVIRRLYDQGILPRKQMRESWSTGPIHRLIRNETYVGRHFYYKSESVVTRYPMAKTQKKYQHRHTMKGSRRRRPREEWIEVAAPAIISEELFTQAAAQIKQNGKLSQRFKKNPYLFGGLIQCVCGVNRTGEGRENHYYYRCNDRLMKFPQPRTCFEPGINVQVLDTVGWMKLVELLTNPQLLKDQLQRYVAEKKIQIGKSPKKAELLLALKSIEQEERRYVKAWGIGTMSEAIYIEQMNSVARRRAEISIQLDKPEEDRAEKLLSIDLDSFVEPFKQFLGNLSYEDKLFTVRKIVDKVIATKEQVTICGLIPAYSTVVSEQQVVLDAKHWYRRPSQCW